MREEEVLKHVARDLDSRDYSFFVDSGYSSDTVDELSGTLENCRVNETITIGRRIPDIIGFTNQREIFAVEVKGEDAIRKGIGQAAHYRQGVHLSYLAATDAALEEFRETALSCGLGLFSIQNSGAVGETRPMTNIGATAIDRTRRALAVKTSRFQSAQNSFPPITRPENALLPIITIITHEAKQTKLNGSQGDFILSEQKCEDAIIDHDKTFNQPRPAISLAVTLQLIQKEVALSGTILRVSDSGKSAFYLMAGLVGSKNPEELYEFVGDLKNKRYLYKHSSELAAFLRDRYLSIPDVRLLMYVLASHEGNHAELSQILAETALSSPDAFLNLFCGRGKEAQFRELIENSQRVDASDEAFRKEIIDLTSPNSLYNFLYQIRHIELLTEGTQPVHQNDEIAIGSHHWQWDPEMIGELGAETY